MGWTERAADGWYCCCNRATQVGHWVGLSHTWAQAATDQTTGCLESAKYTSWAALYAGDSDAVRDTPPQAANDAGKPILFDCNSGPTPLQSCDASLGFPSGDNYYANFANYMSYSYLNNGCTWTLTPSQNARSRCVYECHRLNACFDSSFRL
jgi:hypothetical protein